MVFGLTRPGIEPQSTASVADASSTRPLIGYWSKKLILISQLHASSYRKFVISQTWRTRGSARDPNDKGFV